MCGLKTAQGKLVYQVRWKILNARDYGAVCSRPRVYIVGIKGEQTHNQFHWPVTSVAPPFSRYLIDGHTDSDAKNRQCTVSEALALERSVQAHLVSGNRRLDTKAIVDAGIEAAVEGRTSLAEVRRVAGEVDRFASAAG